MEAQEKGEWSRLIKDFLDPITVTKAEILEVHSGAPSSRITGLEYDSRKAGEGCLFFALPGLHADGHDFISEAIRCGARAIVHEKELGEYREDVMYIRARDSRFAMSPISDSF